MRLWCLCLRRTKKRLVRPRNSEEEQGGYEVAKRYRAAPQIRFWTKWQLGRDDHGSALMTTGRTCHYSEYPSEQGICALILMKLFGSSDWHNEMRTMLSWLVEGTVCTSDGIFMEIRLHENDVVKGWGSVTKLGYFTEARIITLHYKSGESVDTPSVMFLFTTI